MFSVSAYKMEILMKTKCYNCLMHQFTFNNNIFVHIGDFVPCMLEGFSLVSISVSLDLT